MKVYCGIFQDGLEIKIAFVQKRGSKFSILKFLSVPSAEYNFSTSIETNLKENSEFDLIIGDEVSSSRRTNLTEIINFFPLDEVKFVPVVTQPLISYLVFSSEEKTNLKEKLKEEWSKLTNRNLEIEKIDHIEYKNKSIVSTILQEQIPILDEINALREISDTKSIEILPLKSADICFINYFFNYYHIEKAKTYLLLYVGTDSLRMIFIKDGKIVHINGYQSIVLSQRGLGEFISSKIVLEMEYAGLTELTDIILTGEINNEFYSSFKNSFPFTNVQLLNVEPFDLNNLAEEEKARILSYSFPLLAILDELNQYKGIKKNLSIHSKKVSKISVIKKIDFLSILFSFILIGITYYSIQTYLQNEKEINQLKVQVQKTEDIQKIPAEQLKLIDNLNNRFVILTSYKSKLDQLLLNSSRWSEFLKKIDYFKPTKQKMWLTQISPDEKNDSQIVIKGLTISRNSIPDLLRIFSQGEIKNIYVNEIRGKKIFQFEILVNF